MATFTSSYAANTKDDFTATINWGDGTTTLGTGANAGKFVVSANDPNGHSYADEGTYTVTTLINDDGSGSASTSVQSTITITEADTLSATATALSSALEGALVSNTQVATFTSSYAANTKDDFTATINWGDGTTTSGTITLGTGANAGKFVVSADATGHSYADEGTYTVTTVISDDGSGTATKTVTQTLTVNDADVLTEDANQPTLAAQTEGIVFSGLALATFDDSFSGATAADFTTTIDWGDGTTLDTSTGKVSGSASSAFTVSGDHRYAHSGTYTVTVTLSDGDSNGMTASVSNKLTVTSSGPPPQTTASLSGTAGKNGWYVSNVGVTLSATDNNSGVAQTLYQIDGGSWQTYRTAFTVSGDKIHTVNYYSTNNAGDSENIQTLTIKIDTTAPDVTINGLASAVPFEPLTYTASAGELLRAVAEEVVQSGLEFC